MHSSLHKHVWLIQPTPPFPPVTPVDATGGDSIRFSPSWDLLCLQSFILERTGHTCSLIDTRCHESIPVALEQLHSPPDQRATAVAVIYATQATLGPACAIAAHIRELHPEMLNIMCGPYISSFPETIGLLSNFDYGLAGDSEIVLRNLLDFLDIEHRLKLVPGLAVPGVMSKRAHWAQDLQSLSLPEWFRVDWRAYSHFNHFRGVHLEARLSRGNSQGKEDAAWPCPDEPHRMWSMQQMAQLLQKCSGHGISELVFIDPPGFWSDSRLAEWCKQINVIRNSQAWSFQMMPRHLSPEVLNLLATNACSRVELIIPTCDPQLRAARGLDLNDREIAAVIASFRAAKIEAQLKYWIQGPAEKGDEASRIFQHIKAMDFPPLSIYPYPFHHDSILFREMQDTCQPPPFSAWLEWAQKPDGEPPPSLWHGAASVQECQRIMHSVHKWLRRNPWRHIKYLMRKLSVLRRRSR